MVHVDFVTTNLAINLWHLKPLYMTAYIESLPVSKVFVNYGATVIIIPLSVMKTLKGSKYEPIPSGITMSNFVDDKSPTQCVKALKVTIAGKPHMTSFFVVDLKTEYNA